MIPAGLEDLAALRVEIEQIAGSASQLSAAPVGPPSAISYSFGIVSSAEDKIVAIVSSIRQTLATLAPVAHFETTIDGFTARTVIDYSGFAASVWSTGTTAKLVSTHLESLHQAYAFRAAVIAILAAVGNAVVAISIAIGNPLTFGRAINSAEALKSAVDRLAAAVAVAVARQSASALG